MKISLGGISDAFADRNFRLYSVGSIVSWLSFFVQAIAVAWTAWELTHSTTWLAIVALADAVPNIVLIPIGGVIADRSNRFNVMLLAYAVATVQAALLAGFALSGHLTIGILTALAAVHGAAHAFSIPASYGLMPRFIALDRLPSAISVAAAYQQAGLFVGPALAGWVIATFGAGIAFASNVAGYLVFFLSVALMRTPETYVAPGASDKSFLADFRDGLTAIMRNAGLLSLLALTLFGDMLASGVRQMAPAFSAVDLGAGIGGLATLLASGGIGATLAALWLAHGGGARIVPGTILWAFLGFLAAVTGLMLSVHLVTASIAMIGLGATYEICRTGTVALLQISVPDALRGRVMSTQFLILRLAGSIGVAVVGAGGTELGLRVPILALTAIALIVWAMTFARRERIVSAFAAAGM